MKRSQKSPSRIYLVTGYRGTGKDTFCQQIQRCSKIEWNWVVLCSPDSQKTIQPLKLLKQGKKCKAGKNALILPDSSVGRIAFADELKKEVCNELNIPFEKCEALKDTVISTNPERTLRSFLIERALEVRDQNPDHWAELALGPLKEKLNLLKEKKSYIITDWRFKNELSYTQKFCREQNFELVTIRLFRSEVSIPINVNSENELDDIITDFVMVTEDNFLREHSKLLDNFPQYSEYIMAKVENIPILEMH